MAKPLMVYKSPFRGSKKVSSITFNTFVFLWALGVIFAFNSADFFHYWSHFNVGSLYGNKNTMLYEQVFNWYAELTNSFFIWRITIWGLGILMMAYIAKHLDLQNRDMMLAIVFWGFTLDYYTRGMVGHIMIVLGTVLLVDKKSKTLYKIIGLILFCASYFFHKSMYVNIIFALLAFYPFGKKTIRLSLILFPFLTVLATWLVNNIASGALEITLGDAVGGVGDNSMEYAGDARIQVNTLGLIANIITYTPEYLTLAYLTYKIEFKQYLKGIAKERGFKYLFRFSYVAIYIASLFAFTDASNWLYLRFKYMAAFPLVFVLAKVWSLESSSNKWIRWIIILSVLSLVLAWLSKFSNWNALYPF